MAAEGVVIVLLRAVNVAGSNKLPMASLREVLTEAGLKDVRTYIQSGNVICKSKLSPAKVASLVEETIASEFGLKVPTVALSTEELARAINQWPVPQGAPAKALHCIVFEKNVEAQRIAQIDAAVAEAQTTGCEDFAEVMGRFIYLYTPDGIGTSKFARQISSPKIGGTARNWNTANTLLEMASNGS
ncbi:MAG: DUF1697 domain-containing protein [Actinomycetota bacterium]|nr:DUF1697 domain-containing protein [Actinomycetota bacterium]